MYSIQKLKEDTPFVNLSSSPKKCDKLLRCAVLTKSQLKATASGSQMFTMTLCDTDPSSTIKAVCFDESLFHQLQPLKTYIIKGFKIRRGYNGITLQIHINSEAQIELSKLQYKIEKQTFNISQIIRKETANVKTLNVKCKIIDVEEPKLVGKYPTQYQKRDVICADSTGSITLVLWRERATNIEFKTNDTITIENATTATFNNTINLTTTGETTITKINDLELASVQPDTCAQKPNQVITSVNTRILAVKEFRATSHCINCKNTIALSQNDDSPPELLTCELCNSIFLLEDGKVTNECSVLLSTNKQWFLAKTAVIKNIFNWMQVKITHPSTKDMMNVLKLNYTMTINLTNKTIEDAVITEEPKETEPKETDPITAKKQKQHDDQDELLDQVLHLLQDEPEQQSDKMKTD